jgi:hypothetical protein
MSVAHAGGIQYELSFWQNSRPRSAYYNGVWCVFALETVVTSYLGRASGYRIFRSTNRKDWSEALYIAASPSSAYLVDGFDVTQNGFIAWGTKSGTPANFVMESANGLTWYNSDTAYEKTLRFNPVTNSMITGGTGKPWVYGYDSASGICAGIGKIVSSTIFGVTTYSKHEDTKVYTSTDGANWTLAYTADKNLNFCAAGGGQMVAGYYDNAGSGASKLFYSPDAGSTWSQVLTSNHTSVYFLSAEYQAGGFAVFGQFFTTDSKGTYSTSVAYVKNGVLTTKRPDSLWLPY